MEEFKKLIDDLTNEYQDYFRRYNNGLTCEFSTSGEDFEEKVDYAMKKIVDQGYWHMMQCSTCASYDSNKHWHFQIIEAHSWEEHNSVVRKLQSEHNTMSIESGKLLKEIKGKDYYRKGALEKFVDLFDSLVEQPEQYDEYLEATMFADLHRERNSWYSWQEQRKSSETRLAEMLELDEDKVLHTISRDVTVEKGGVSQWNMFSEMNDGCVAYVHLSEFTQKVGDRFRITLGKLPARK